MICFGKVSHIEWLCFMSLTAHCSSPVNTPMKPNDLPLLNTVKEYFLQLLIPHAPTLHKISWRSVKYLWSNPADRYMNGNEKISPWWKWWFSLMYTTLKCPASFAWLKTVRIIWWIQVVHLGESRGNWRKSLLTLISSTVHTPLQ